MKRSEKRKKVSIQLEINKKQFDIPRLTKDIQAEGRRVFEQAAIEFVQTTAASVPSLTGQAKAALINIAEQLNLDPGITPDSPPLSENMHLYYSQVKHGNTVERGSTLSSSKLTNTTTRVYFQVVLNITAAHNGFGYFSYWDQKLWHSVEDAVKSVDEFIKSNFIPPQIRVKNG